MKSCFYVAVRICLLLSTVAIALTANQEPLGIPEHPVPTVPSTNGWNFNFSSSAPHYFISFHGLLQQWSNTFFPNGHSIAPCEVPAFTKLYHGRQDSDVPPSPEWVSFDIGMAYGIMGGTRNSHMLTYQTTRAVQCIYFDGESATLMGTGQMDTQMLHIYGNISGVAPPDRGFRGLWDEYARAIGLCDWIQEKKLGGSGWGVEGIVRMNAGFEMIWCNFTSVSVRLVSHLNITSPLLPEKDSDEGEVSDILERSVDPTPTSYYPLPPAPTKTDRATNPSNPPGPPNWRRDWNREPFFRMQTWSWFTAGTAHYGSSGTGSGLGESRVKVLGCGFMSYYAPKFLSAATSRAREEQKNLNLTADGLWNGPGENGTRSSGLTSLTRRRRAHTLGGVSSEDAAVMKADSERILRELFANSAICSGMDWSIVTNEIVQTYATELTMFLNMLQQYDRVAENKTALRDWAVDIRDQTHFFLLPFIQFPNTTSNENWKRGSRLYNETFSYCRFRYTRLLVPSEGVSLGLEEISLKSAVEEVTSNICAVLIDVGLSMESVWNSNFNHPSSSPHDFTHEINRWTEGIEELMAWLGWADQWVSCPKCAWDEKCYIPMWPLLKMNFGGGPRRPPPGGGKPGHERPGYGYPPHDGPPPHRPEDGKDEPRRGRPPGGWQPDETDLWEPKCVKRDFFVN